MNRLILAGAAVLAFTMPVSAQELAVAADGDVYVLSPTQKPIYDAWPLERRSGYDQWPNNYKSYYWTLSPSQQEGWWVLNDEQRARVFAMTPEQRTQAWSSIERQMTGGSAMAGTPSANASMTAQTATTAAAGANTMAPRYVSNAVTQSIGAAHSGPYPVCKSDADDNCINAWEAGRRGPNVSRPLGYWPGKPASDK